MTLHAGTEFNRSPSFLPSEGTVNNWADEITGTIVQPLLRGRGRLLWDAAERKATLSRDAAVLGRRLAAIQAVQVVIAAYWDLVFAERQVAITRQSLELAKERLRITQISSDGGKVPRSEIPAVQQIIATREEDVLNGELGVLDRSIALRRAAGMPVGKGELGLRLGAELAPGDTAWDLGEVTERAFAASPELAQLGQAGRGGEDRHRGHRERAPAAARRGAHARADGPGRSSARRGRTSRCSSRSRSAAR